MYKSADIGISGSGSGTAALSLAQRTFQRDPFPHPGTPSNSAKNPAIHDSSPPNFMVLIGEKARNTLHRAAVWVHETDLTPDLAQNVLSRTWWRGLATLILLIAAAVWTAPGVTPLNITTPVMASRHWEEARALAIRPRALGSDSGKHMAATDLVQPLAAAPERPMLAVSAMLGEGDSLSRVLERAGVGGAEASAISRLVGGEIDLADIGAGTRLELVLGRRATADVPRPLDTLSFRARFDLRMEIERIDGALSLRRIPISVDDTPMRIQARVGDSLYRSARAAGASPQAVETYLRVIAQQLSIGRDVQSSDQFDLIFEHRRAETGEVQSGELLYAGLIRGSSNRLQMVKWTSGDNTQWFEASGVGKTSGGMSAPTNGRLTSNYGMRRHPILGYVRMHAGVDYGAAYGSPVYAVTDGVVTLAGRKGGYGNFIQLSHGGGMGTGYGHLSRIAVRDGQSVKRGQIIGSVGSSGLSTGPHLHFEVYRNGANVNPASVRFVQAAQLSGKDLAGFKTLLGRLTGIAPGASAPTVTATAAN